MPDSVGGRKVCVKHCCVRHRRQSTQPHASTRRLATIARAAQRRPPSAHPVGPPCPTPPVQPLSAPALAVLLAANPLPALADEGGVGGAVASYFNQLANLNAAGVALVASPLVLYASFRAYQSQINPRAKWSDFVFLGAFLLIVANVVSIAVYKTRLF